MRPGVVVGDDGWDGAGVDVTRNKALFCPNGGQSMIITSSDSPLSKRKHASGSSSSSSSCMCMVSSSNKSSRAAQQ
jgi:hypothetical protein